MNLKNLTNEAKVDLFKQLVSDLELSSLKSDEPEFELLPIEKSVETAIDRINFPYRMDGLSCGYPSIDKAIGGFAPEELIVVSGGTGQGKTQFVQCMLLNMALDNIPVLFFTLEMPPVETTVRFLRMVKSKGAFDVLHELPIYYYHGTNATIPVLEAAIKKGIAQGIKCVAIDHLHFFSKGFENQASEIGHLVREIKLLARKYEIPIILLCHIKKLENPKRFPGVGDLKDSAGIAQDADVIMMIWRDMDEQDDMFGARVMKMRIEKNRRRGYLDHLQYEMDNNGYLVEGKYNDKQRNRA